MGGVSTKGLWRGSAMTASEHTTMRRGTVLVRASAVVAVALAVFGVLVARVMPGVLGAALGAWVAAAA